MREDMPDRDALGAEHEQQRQFAGQGDGLLVAAVVAGHELGDLVVEHFRARQLGQAAFDVTRRGGEVAGEDVAEIALAFDEVALVGQHHQRVADRGVAVRMVLHGVADDVGHLDEPAIVLLVQRPEDAALDRLEAVRQVGDGAVADDVGGVIEEAAVDAAVERQSILPGTKGWARRRAATASARTCALAVAARRPGAGLAAVGRCRTAGRLAGGRAFVWRPESGIGSSGWSDGVWASGVVAASIRTVIAGSFLHRAPRGSP